jgi:hypothetical protein
MAMVSASRRSLLAGALVGACMLPLAAHATVTGTITQLSTGSLAGTQTNPKVSGLYVAWTSVSQLSSGTDSDVYFQNRSLLEGGSAAIDLTNTLTESEGLQDIDGSNVLWVHKGPNITGDVVLYDTSTTPPQPSTLARSSTSTRYDQAAIRGNYVVYVRSTDQDDIAGYDLGLRGPLTITSDLAVQLHPRVSRDGLVVYEDYTSGNAKIVSYQISRSASVPSGPPKYVAYGPAAQTAPDIDGNYVVWIESIDGKDQINSLNLSTPSATPQLLTTAASHKYAPRVSGTRVVWSDDRNDNGINRNGLDLYTYDFATGGSDELLVGGAGDQTVADIDGSRIVYTSNDTGFEQVFLYELTSAPPPSQYPEGCDPAKTNPADAAVVMVKDPLRPSATVYGGRTYTAEDGKNYWLCIENGTNGDLRTSALYVWDGSTPILTSSDFRPATNPPTWVAAKLLAADGDGGNHGGIGAKHVWSAKLLGTTLATVTITLRVGK